MGSVTSVRRRILVFVSSTSSAALSAASFSASHAAPSGANSRMRLKEATVEIGTQCSGFAVCRVHMNLSGTMSLRHAKRGKATVLVIRQVGVGEVEFDCRLRQG